MPLKRDQITDSDHTCAPISDLPSNISTVQPISPQPENTQPNHERKSV